MSGKIKITEEFPFTVPILAEVCDWHPYFIRALMPPPDHFSGTTPRWRINSLPAYKAALCVAVGSREPRVLCLRDATPSDWPEIVAFFHKEEDATRCQKWFVAQFWTFPRGKEIEHLRQSVEKFGGTAR